MEENDSVHDEGLWNEYWQEGEIEEILAMLLTHQSIIPLLLQWGMKEKKNDHIVIFIIY